MEFPGYLRPSEYKTEADRKKTEKLVQVYTSAVYDVFLQAYFVEEESTTNSRFVSSQ